MKTILLMTVISICLSACSADRANRPDYSVFISENDLIEKSRIQEFRFRGWQPLDDKHLILSSTHKRAYLITLMSPCTEMAFTQSIQVNQSFSTILSAKFDSISVPGQSQLKCTIRTIHELNKEQKQALTDWGKSKKVRPQILKSS